MEDPLEIPVSEFIRLIEAVQDAPAYIPDDEARSDIAAFVQALDGSEDD